MGRQLATPLLALLIVLLAIPLLERMNIPIIPLAFCTDVEITTDSYYTTGNRSTWQGLKTLHPSSSSTYSATAQSFCTLNDGNQYKLLAIKLTMYKVGSPTGTGYAQLYAHSGTFGTSSVPTGAALATSDGKDVSTLPTSGADIWLNFTGAEQVTLETNTYYVVTWENPSSGTIDNSNYVQVGVDATSPTHEGNAANFRNSAWTAVSSADLAAFYVYGEEVADEGQDLTFTLTGLTHLYASVNKDIALKFTKTGLIHTYASLGFNKELPFLLTGTAYALSSLQKSLEVSRLLTGLVYIYGSLGAAFEMGAQNLYFTLTHTLRPYGSLDRGIETAHTLTNTIWLYAALSSGKGFIAVLSQSVYILASTGVAKELIRILPGLVQVWHTLETATEGVAVNLLVTLFEAVNVWESLAADLSEVAEAALTIDDAYAIGALGLILALVAIALIVIHRRS